MPYVLILTDIYSSGQQNPDCNKRLKGTPLPGHRPKTSTVVMVTL